MIGTVMLAMFASISEIKINLQLDSQDYLVGERVRGVLTLENSSPDRIGTGAFRVAENGVTNVFRVADKLFIEMYRGNELSRMTQTGNGKFVDNFYINSSEGQKFEVLLDRHYGLGETGRYMAKPVFVHGKTRYEGQPRVFDVVDGVRIGSAMQMFTNRRGLQREFELAYWSRKHGEHLFLKARNSGIDNRRWETRDLGTILRIDRPTVSVLATGEVVIFHRLNQDQFVRSEFWSLPDALEYRKSEAVQDPETAGSARVRELYKDGGVKPKVNPWWKFW